MENLEHKKEEITEKLRFFGEHIKNKEDEKKAFWIVDFPLILVSVFSIYHFSSAPQDNYELGQSYGSYPQEYFKESAPISAPAILNVKVKAFSALDEINYNNELTNAELIYIINDLTTTKSSLNSGLAQRGNVPFNSQIAIKEIVLNIDGLSSLAKVIARDNIMDKVSKTDSKIAKSYLVNILNGVNSYQKSSGKAK